ncbi:MAG: sensor histidine kinase [Lawsonibacter sp.]|jgi:signal transduction histidine kinase
MKDKIHTLSWKLSLFPIAILLIFWFAFSFILVFRTAKEIRDGAYSQAEATVLRYRFDSYFQAYEPDFRDDWWIQHGCENSYQFLFPWQQSNTKSFYLPYYFTSTSDSPTESNLLPVHTFISIRLQPSEKPAYHGLTLLLEELSAADLHSISQAINSGETLPALSATGTRNGYLFYVDTLTIGSRTYSTGRTGGKHTISLSESNCSMEPGSYTLYPMGAQSKQDWELLLGARDWVLHHSQERQTGLRSYFTSYSMYTLPVYQNNKPSQEVWIWAVLASTPLQSALEEHLGTLLCLLALVPIFGLLFSALIRRMVIAPIQQTQRDFQRVETLQFQDLEGDTLRKDELGDLNRCVRHMAEQLQTRWDDERALEQRRQEFVAAASHELKTPLALLRGYAEGLEQGIGDPSRYLSGIELELERMNHLVMEMLDQTRLQHMDALSAMERVDFSALVTGLLQEMAPLFQNLQLTAQISSGLSLSGDYSLLQRAISNLLTNAAKFCKPKGQVLVSLSQQQNGPSLAIENTASPIPQADLSRLFEPFFRSSATRDRSGSGMGLAIAYQIFQLHHLQCQVENTALGVRFTVTPMQPQDAGSSHSL